SSRAGGLDRRPRASSGGPQAGLEPRQSRGDGNRDGLLEDLVLGEPLREELRDVRVGAPVGVAAHRLGVQAHRVGRGLVGLPGRSQALDRVVVAGAHDASVPGSQPLPRRTDKDLVAIRNTVPSPAAGKQSGLHGVSLLAALSGFLAVLAFGAYA